MKKSLGLTISVFMMLGFLGDHVFAQSTEEILEKMIEAQGGRAKLASIKDATVTGDFEMAAMGMSGQMTRYQKEPNLLRMDIEIMGMVITQAYDGEVAWMDNPQMGVMEMPALQAEYFKRDTYGMGALLNPKKFGISYTLKGKESIEGKEYLVLEQTYEDGVKATMYIDQQTYLPYMARAMTLDQMEMETEGETIMSDYRDVDGVMTAFQMTIFQGGEEFITFTASEITYNTGLEDSLFKMEK